MASRFEGVVSEFFDASIYDFISDAAERCASIMVDKRALGESLDVLLPRRSLPEAMIAGIAAASGLTIATRNRAEFRNCGLALVNRWAVET